MREEGVGIEREEEGVGIEREEEGVGNEREEEGVGNEREEGWSTGSGGSGALEWAALCPPGTVC